MERFLDNILDREDDELYPDESPASDNLPGVLWRPVAFINHNDSLPSELVAQLCREVHEEMVKRKLDLTTYLWYVTNWQLKETVADRKLQHTRAGLMKSDQLGQLLRTWHRPPRRHSGGVSTTAAKATLEAFAVETVQRIINEEMRAVAPILTSPAEALSEESLLFDIPAVGERIKATAPTFFSILRSACYTPRQEQRNKLKNPDPLATITIANASFMRSHLRNRFQKLFSVYFHASGLSERGLDTLSALGMTMSQSWTYTALDTLSIKAQVALRADLKRYPAWDGGHDNLNIARKKYEQRLDNLKTFDSGTVGAIFVHKAPDAFMPNRAAYMKQLADSHSNTLKCLDLLKLDHNAVPKLKPFHIFHILDALKEAVPFAFESYEHKDSSIWTRPSATYQLPIGKAHATTQHLLRVAHIDEATYEGNIACFAEWYKQLGVTTETEQKAMLQRVIPWKGDQLTADRILHILGFRCRDLNAWDRWEHILPVFGWLHALMAITNSMHKQYYGTASGMGLSQTFNVLKRKGLASPSTQGNFHQMLKEALHHVAEARFRDAWCVVANVDSLDQLRVCSPEQLTTYATTILENLASTDALTLERSRKDNCDEQLVLSIQFNRDLLDYITLCDAISTGDVGRMRDLLPRLLFRFVGGGNSHYVVQMLETLQGFEREWPEDLRTYILRFGWLANLSGHPHAFVGFDNVIEWSVNDVKNTFGTSGPGATWQYLYKVTASIPTQQKTKEHVQHFVNHFGRGKSHTHPKKEDDVATLQQKYAANEIHRRKTARKIAHAQDQAADYYGLGSAMDTLTTTVRSWAARRTWCKRATTDEWPPQQETVVEGLEAREDAERPEANEDGEGPAVNEDEEAMWGHFEEEFQRYLDKQPVLSHEGAA